MYPVLHCDPFVEEEEEAGCFAFLWYVACRFCTVNFLKFRIFYSILIKKNKQKKNNKKKNKKKKENKKKKKKKKKKLVANFKTFYGRHHDLIVSNVFDEP